MLRRFALLCFSLWMFAAGGLAAASPCDMAPGSGMAAPVATSAHCDMAAGPAPDAPDPAPADADMCCCPVVLAALPAPHMPEVSPARFTLPVAIAAPLAPSSRTLIPEPPPPKA